MKLRTWSRRAASIGSNQSSRSRVPVSASDCETGSFVLSFVMAWSPPARERRIVGVSTPGDYATFNSNHTPDGTSLALRPAHSRSHQIRDRYPKASDISSPPCLLRLLPAGAVAGWALHPLEKRRLVTAHVAGGSLTDRRLIRHAPRSAEALCPNRHRAGRYNDGIGRELAALGDVEYRNTSAQKTKRQ